MQWLITSSSLCPCLVLFSFIFMERKNCQVVSLLFIPGLSEILIFADPFFLSLLKLIHFSYCQNKNTLTEVILMPNSSIWYWQYNLISNLFLKSITKYSYKSKEKIWNSFPHEKPLYMGKPFYKCSFCFQHSPEYLCVWHLYIHSHVYTLYICICIYTLYVEMHIFLASFLLLLLKKLLRT